MTEKQLYRIIDEPKVRAAESLIVNPLVILLVAIFLPFLWTPPLMGRYWMPFAWIVINGFFLGSPTFWKEFLISSAALLAMVGLFFSLAVFKPENASAIYPYFNIALSAVFFLFLYIVVFIQMTSWSIHEYIRESQRK